MHVIVTRTITDSRVWSLATAIFLPFLKKLILIFKRIEHLLFLMFVQQAITKGCNNENMLVFYVKQRTLSPFLPFLKNFVSKYELTLLLPHGEKLVCKRCSLDKAKTVSFVAMESTLLTTYCC